MLNVIGEKPIRQEFKSIEMIRQTSTRKIDIYQAEITDVDRKFKMSCELNRIEKDVLLNLPNRKYKELIESNEHLMCMHE